MTIPTTTPDSAPETPAEMFRSAFEVSAARFAACLTT